MLKRIPKSDISIRPFKAYKEWSFNESSTGSISLLEANISSSELSNGVPKNSLYGQLSAQFYNGNEDNPFLRSGVKSNRYITAPLARERYLSRSAKVISIPNIYVGAGIKKGSLTLLDNKDLQNEIKNFKDHYPKNFDRYIEPFAGGAAVFFDLNFKGQNVINDVHNELIAFYKSIKEGNSQQIKEFMNQHPNNEEEYYKVRDNMELNTQLDIAKRFYYLRKTCFRGMLRYNKKGGFNIPFGKYKTISYNELDNKDYENILKNTHIFNDDFTTIFDNYNNDKNFMFLDPPYDSVFTDYGYCKFGKDEHIKLANYFKNTKIRCLMVIGKTDFISELYKEYIVDEFDKKYKFKIHSNRIGDEINTKHLIIKNF
jgi:DNA adenine methylase